ncbi:hypothetical protein SCANM63S_02429 [Streptomyces canarius]
MQGTAEAGVESAGLVEQAGRAAQFTGDVGAQVGGLGEAPAPVGGLGAEVGGAGEGGYRAGRVPAVQFAAGRFLQEDGDRLVGFHRRFGQVPGPALGVT